MSVMGCLDSWFGTGGFNRQKQQKGMGNEQLAVRIASPNTRWEYPSTKAFLRVFWAFQNFPILSSLQKTGYYQESIT